MYRVYFSIQRQRKRLILTKMLQSLSGTVLEHSLCSQCLHCPDLGLSLYEGHGLKLFYKHLGHDDAENMQGCDRQGFCYKLTRTCQFII